MRFGLIFGLILLAIAGRLIPHPDNFTPVLAVALFGGAMLSSRLAYAVPLAALAASDVLLSQPYDAMTVVVHGCFLAAVFLGRWVGARRTWARTGIAALSGSLLFFVVTNFAVWALPNGLYAHTLDGLLECYVMAIPFFRNALAGDLFWVAMLFGLYEAGHAWLKSLRAEPGQFAR